MYCSSKNLDENEVMSEIVWIKDETVNDESFGQHERLQLLHRRARVAGVRKLHRQSLQKQFKTI